MLYTKHNDDNIIFVTNKRNSTLKPDSSKYWKKSFLIGENSFSNEKIPINGVKLKKNSFINWLIWVVLDGVDFHYRTLINITA